MRSCVQVECRRSGSLESVLDSLVQAGFILDGEHRGGGERGSSRTSSSPSRGDVFEDPYSTFQSVARQIVERHSVAYAKPNQLGGRETRPRGKSRSSGLWPARH